MLPYSLSKLSRPSGFPCALVMPVKLKSSAKIGVVKSIRLPHTANVSLLGLNFAENGL